MAIASATNEEGDREIANSHHRKRTTGIDSGGRTLMDVFRLSRRQVLGRLAVLGVLPVLAACGGLASLVSTRVPAAATPASASAQAPAPAATQAPAALVAPTIPLASHAAATGGGAATLKLLWWQAPTILNPHLAQGAKDDDAAAPILEPLAWFGPD